jgi:hypothetical protein
MPTLAQSQQQPQKPGSSCSARSHIAKPGLRLCGHPILPLQNAIGNQAAQRTVQILAEPSKNGLTVAPPNFGHDFDRIPVHASPAVALQAKLAINTPGDEI